MPNITELALGPTREADFIASETIEAGKCIVLGDQQLLALMRDNPGATVTRLARLSSRSWSSIISSLSRLEADGLVDHGRRGSWTAVDADLVDAPPPSAKKPWITPLSSRHVARFAAGGRVREEKTS
jgi:hypothetical protein